MKFRFLILLVSIVFIHACGSDPVRGNQEKAVNDYVQIGLGYLSNGNKDQARQNLLRALKIDPSSIVANNAIALLYQSEGEMALAEKHFKFVLNRDKGFSQGRNNYARFLYFQDRVLEARDQYKIVTEDVNYRLRTQAFIGLALSEKSLGNIGAADEALQRSISLNPRAGAAVIELAELRMQQKDYVASKGYLDQYEDLARPTPRSLLLGLKLAENFGEKNQRESYSMALRNMFPDSREAREFVLSERSGELE